MSETKTETKDELKKRADEMELTISKQNEQLSAVSVGYQQAINRANTLNALCAQYEQTINSLTARLLETYSQNEAKQE
jgi:hypothetical protein